MRYLAQDRVLLSPALIYLSSPLGTYSKWALSPRQLGHLHPLLLLQLR